MRYLPAFLWNSVIIYSLLMEKTLLFNIAKGFSIVMFGFGFVMFLIMGSVANSQEMRNAFKKSYNPKEHKEASKIIVGLDKIADILKASILIGTGHIALGIIWLIHDFFTAVYIKGEIEKINAEMLGEAE